MAHFTWTTLFILTLSGKLAFVKNPLFILTLSGKLAFVKNPLFTLDLMAIAPFYIEILMILFGSSGTF